MTVQELTDWLEGVAGADGVEGVDPSAIVTIALRPDGRAALTVATMSGETLSLPLEVSEA